MLHKFVSLIAALSLTFVVSCTQPTPPEPEPKTAPKEETALKPIPPKPLEAPRTLSPATPLAPTPIDVHIAFDGSNTLSVWKETLDFALEHDVKFTFFIVGNHLLADDLSMLYQPPRKRQGRSDVGYGGTREEVAQRIAFIRRAYAEGHEIGGHANGHWDGSDFTYEEWMSELSQFKNFVENAYELNELPNPDPKGWQEITQSIIGFRAPLLAHNDAMYAALAAQGYKYDTSQSRRLPLTGSYTHQGMTLLPLSGLNTKRGRTITMDYNFYVLDTGRPQGAGINMLEAYRAHLREAQKIGAPAIQIGHHFARWNGGQYWWALQTFIIEHCDTEIVSCPPLRARLNTQNYYLKEATNADCLSLWRNSHRLARRGDSAVRRFDCALHSARHRSRGLG